MNRDHPRPLRWRAATAITAGLLGTGAALTAIAAAGGAPSPVQLAGVHEDQPGPCDEAEHAGDPECVGSPSSTVDDSSTSSTIDDRSTSTTAAAATSVPDGSSKTIDAAPGGTVVVAVQGGQLVVVSAMPNAGWRLGEQQTVGREVEVRFLTSTARVDVKAELEDGQIRTRVRLRALDDNGSGPGSTSTTVDDRGGNDDGVNHDAGDDHGADGAGHDAGDDSGHHGGDSGSSGSGSGGSGSGGHGGSGSGRDHPED